MTVRPARAQKLKRGAAQRGAGKLAQASYPSAAPAGMPAASERQGVAAPRRQGAAATLRSFAQPQQALTVPIRGIARVAQRQLAQAAAVRHRQRVQQREQAREILRFALRLAETLFHYGADAADIDAAVITVCSVYGLQDVEVNITHQAITLNYVSEFDDELVPAAPGEEREKLALTLVRVVRSVSENYRALTQLYDLVHRIGAGGVSRTAAERGLAAINAEKKLYSPATLWGWNLVFAAAFTLGVGGSWRAALVSLVVFSIVNVTLFWVSKLALPNFFTMILSSAVITLLALAISSPEGWLVSHGFYVSAPHVVAAGLMMFLPTFRLVSAVQDALHGFALTAAGKFVVTSTSFIGLMAGIAVALTLVNLFEAASLDVQATVFNPPPVWVSVLGMAVGSAVAAATWQGSMANIGLCLLVSLAGQGAYYGVSLAAGAEAGRLNVLVGAFIVGLASACLAHLLHAPASTYYVPGMMFMLPGLTIFRSAYSLLSGEHPDAGLAGLASAGMTVALMATGIVLGTYLWDAAAQRFRGRKQA